MSNHRKYWGVPETKIIECLQNMPINSFHSTSTFAASGTKCIFALFKKAVKRELLILTLLHFKFQLLCIKQHHDDEMCQNKSPARINSNSRNLIEQYFSLLTEIQSQEALIDISRIYSKETTLNYFRSRLMLEFNAFHTDCKSRVERIWKSDFYLLLLSLPSQT